MNRDINQLMSVNVRVDEDAGVRPVNKDGTLGDVVGVVQSGVSPGDAMIFTWVTR